MTRYLAIACAALLAALCVCAYLLRSEVKQSGALAEQVKQAQQKAKSVTETLRLQRQLSVEAAAIDEQQYEALTNAQSENARLRDDIASGKRRLSVATRCPGMPKAGSAPSVDDAETRTELDPAHAQRIVRITEDGDSAIIALEGLQQWVNRVCLGVKDDR